MLVKNEYPRPQFVRERWQNLNGEWQFEFDDNNLGLEEKWFKNEKSFSNKIIVPFVYQSKLSGIEEKEIHDIVWYKRKIQVENKKEKDRVILHFGAVDYEAQIYINEHLVGSHFGGHTSFQLDITPYLDGDSIVIAVRVCDPHQDELLPRGKQSWENESRGIWYTNSTGIWQTVWLECVNEAFIKQVKFTPLFDEGRVNIKCMTEKSLRTTYVAYEIRFRNELISKGRLVVINDELDWDVDLIQNHIFRTNFHDDGWSWTPEHPNLFQVQLNLCMEDDTVLDKITSYFGFRKVHTEKGMVFLNNKPYYQKLVLDQGYWPDGLLTAPDDNALKKDIELAKEMGFNGCRKHQKMEDPRFLYWADQLGYLVWGECASAPMYNDKAVNRLMKEWSEVVERDYNHPSIIVWVPLNESWGIPSIHNSRTQQHFSQTMYHYLHALDETRLVISNDGWEITETDICGIHNYMHGQKQDVLKYEVFKNTLATRENLVNHPSTVWDIYAKGFEHRGEPILLTEFGGIGYDVSGENGWGYTSVTNEVEFLEDMERIMDAVYSSKVLWGYCYTQFTDVEQEINGLLTYDRKPKCILKKIFELNNRFLESRLKYE